MLLATVCVGDMIVTLAKVIPIERNKEPVHNLRFHDIIDNTSLDVEYESENDAFMAFAAWIAADEPEAIPGAATKLRERMGPEMASKLLP